MTWENQRSRLVASIFAEVHQTVWLHGRQHLDFCVGWQGAAEWR